MSATDPLTKRSLVSSSTVSNSFRNGLVVALAFVSACVGGLAFACAANAAPGALDPSFGSGGKVTTTGSPVVYLNKAFALVRQPDGKLVAAGYSSTLSSRLDFALVRYNANGSIDTTFGPNHTGIVRTSIGRGDDIANALVRQPDGKLVAAGVTTSPADGTTRVVLVRYNRNGSRDRSFGAAQTGIVTTSIGPRGQDAANALVLQPDGKLVAAGTSEGRFALVRYNANGSLDTTFGPSHTGIVRTQFGSEYVGAFALVRQPDDKLVAAGSGFDPSGRFTVVRYNADGSVDTTFGNQGKVLTPVGPTDSTGAAARSLALQPDGKLVAAGEVYGGSGGGDIALVRYNADGSLDTSFGTGGKVDRAQVPASASSYLSSLIVQSDGKLVAAGFVSCFGGHQPRCGGNPPRRPQTGLLLVRYEANGQPDTTFGSGGKLVTLIGRRAAANALVLQPDGRVVAAGFFSNFGAGEGFALVRYLP